MIYLLQVIGGTVLQTLFQMLWYGPMNGELFFQLAFKNGKRPADLNYSLCMTIAITAAFGLNNLLKTLIDSAGMDTIIKGCIMGSLFWAFSFLLQIPHVFFEHRSLVLMILHELGHFAILILLCTYYVYFRITSTMN